MTKPSRLLPPGHPDRIYSAEEVIEPYYQTLVIRMLAKGLSDEEIALAVESLAQAHLDTLAANRLAETEIVLARQEAGLEPIDRTHSYTADVPALWSNRASVDSPLMWAFLCCSILAAAAGLISLVMWQA